MPSDLKEFKTYLDQSIAERLKTELAHYQTITHAPVIISLLEHLMTVADGGKRIRPYLTWSVYQHYTQKPDERELLPLLQAIELFHVFCLVHDDVMDEAKTRHGVPTIHTKALSDHYRHTIGAAPSRVADNQAILAGDMLFNTVNKLLDDFLMGSHSEAKAVTKIFRILIDEVCIGQMLDVHITSQPTVSLAEVEEKNRLKTAYYTFARPLHLGVVAAGRTDQTALVTAFGEQLGLLYQLQDDVLDIMGDPTITKKPIFQDVSQNQHTPLSVFARATGGDVATILSRYTGKTLTAEEQLELKTAFINAGVISYAEEMMTRYTDAAKALINRPAIPDGDRLFYEGLLALITKRTT